MSSTIADFELQISDLRSQTTAAGLIPQSAIRNSQYGGFTLLEVLLAMAILSVLMTVVYASFSTAGRNVEQADALRDENDLARTLMARLSDDIANAYINSSMNSPVVLTIFYGKMEEVDGKAGAGSEKIRHDSISLTTLTHWRKLGSKETELWEVGYFFKEKPEGKGFSLVRREKRELNKEVPALDGGDEYEITDRVESLQFRYRQENQMTSTWRDSWDSKSPSSPTSGKLPSLVEIALTLDTGKVYVTQVEVGNFK
jgi:prepilin-type N-terminal cleavage/methylation domain-containing protein